METGPEANGPLEIPAAARRRRVRRILTERMRGGGSRIRLTGRRLLGLTPAAAALDNKRLTDGHREEGVKRRSLAGSDTLRVNGCAFEGGCAPVRICRGCAARVLYVVNAAQR